MQIVHLYAAIYFLLPWAILLGLGRLPSTIKVIPLHFRVTFKVALIDSECLISWDFPMTSWGAMAQSCILFPLSFWSSEEKIIETEWNDSQEQWQTVGNDGFVVRVFRWNEEPEPGSEKPTSLKPRRSQVLHFQVSMGFEFPGYLFYVLAASVCDGTKGDDSIRKQCLSQFGSRLGSSKVSHCFRLTSLGKQRNRTVGNWRTSRSSGWRVEKSPVLTRCLAERFRIRVCNFKNLNFLKSFWKSLHESSFMVI